MALIVDHFWQYPDLDVASLLEEAREMGFEFSSQSYFKFLHLKVNPYSLFKVVHAGIPDEEINAELDDFYGLRPCCQQRGTHAYMGHGPGFPWALLWPMGWDI